MSLNFHPFFREVADRHLQVTVELKNGLQVSGTLQHVDATLNLHLLDTKSPAPQLQGCTRCFIRGSTVKFITLTEEQMNNELLEDLLRREGVEGK